MAIKMLIFGPQGSGKGTQGKLICENYGLVHISTGDIFRDNISRETELGKKVQSIVKSGALVPDELTNALVKDRLSQEDVKSGFLLDGFPRNLSQAEFLDSIVDINLVVVLDVPDEVTIERISDRRMCKECGANFNLKFKPPKEPGKCDRCGGELIQREDDKPSAIKDRLAIYHSETAMLIDRYPERIVLRVNGVGTIDEVFEKIRSGIDKLISLPVCEP